MSEEQELAIELRQLSRNFGEVEAIRSVDLEIKRGELFGLIGPDGAGKTTLLRTLAGLLKISGGEGRVAGIDLNQFPERAKPKIGYMAQQFGLYAELNVVENLRFFADVFDVPKAVFSERMDFLLKFAGLAGFRTRRADRLSGGMQKKLALACCLIHEPEILLLDEPTTGVDPISRREFWRILGDLHLGGTTILVSTPYMDEADRCSRVGLIYEGELIRCDTPELIRKSVEGELLVLELNAGEQLKLQLDSLPGIMEVQVYGDKYHLLVENSKKQKKEIEKYLKRRKIEIRNLYKSMPKMEEAFISIISQLE
jgi:ABC-2 type transport system ATP-binding protein